MQLFKKLSNKLLLTGMFIAVFFPVFSQSDIDDLLFSKNYNQTPVVDVIHDVEAHFGVKVFYKPQWIAKKKITRTFHEVNLEVFFIQFLPDVQLHYTVIQNNNYVLLPANKALIQQGKYRNLTVIGNPLDKGKYKINKVSGKVMEGKTQNPIVGAIIRCKEHNKFTTTNANGEYALNLPMGKTTLEYSCVGLETTEVAVDVMSPGKLSIDLFEETITLDDIIISGYSDKEMMNKAQMGLLQMDVRTMGNLPVMMGEADVVKSMTMLPGVQNGGEMASGFNVRGGNVDQNLVTIDGASLYNTSHLFGMFSTVLPGAVSRVDLFKGTQNAEYGGRASSVMNIVMADGDSLHHNGEVGIGLLNSHAMINGPLRKGKISYLVGGRSTYSDWLLKKTQDVNIRNSSAWFYDGFVKVFAQLSAKAKISTSFYSSYDDFNYAGNSRFAYGSQLGSVNYKRKINSSFFIDANVFYSEYYNQSTNTEFPASSFVFNTGIEQISGKLAAKYFYLNHTFVAGVEGTQFAINPGTKYKYNNESGIKEVNLAKEEARSIAGFIQDEFKLMERWGFSAGVRYSWFANQGPGQVNTYEPGMPKNTTTFNKSLEYGKGETIQWYGGFEPRLGVKYSITEDTKIKGSFAINQQYLQLVSNSTLLSPTDFWKASDTHLKPLKTKLTSLGIFSILPGASLQVSAELYYKSIENQIDYKDGASLFLNPAIEQELVLVNGRSYGLECLLKKQYGNFTGWISYTLSKSELKTNSSFKEEQINKNAYYNSPLHKLHDISVTTNYQISRRWSVGANFVYSSGKPKTLPEQKISYAGIDLVQYSSRNKYQLPDYHRMDVSLTYKGEVKKTAKVHPSLVFSVYNLYGRKNVYTVHYKQSQAKGFMMKPANELYQFSVIGIPLPSITLKLKF
jgi:outer membrane cobalamin receptor